ncbi:MAG: hypothetical protein VYB36_07730, partial [Candidatus Thermoplasmatota archaeon]|nr:hypothetical protein [Candidatus Thermoplasmatota archaeon]
ALLTQLANHGLSVHASLSWVDGIRLIVDASGVKAVEASLRVLGMEVNRVGEASAMITFIGSWKDPEAWLYDLSMDDVDVVDHDTRRIRVLVPRDHVKLALEQTARTSSWLAKA